MDIFERIMQYNGPIGQLQDVAEGQFVFPKLKGPIANHIHFNNKKLICWSYNNYLGLANSEDIQRIDTQSLAKWGMTYPMGSRMMTGDTDLHDEFEVNMASFIRMEKALLLNFGYQGMLSVMDCLLGKDDVVISDEQCHACIIDGIRLHKGVKLIFAHNDMDSLEQQLKKAQEITENSNGGILVVTEGIFSMSGQQGKLKEICNFKSTYNFRLLVDDAHGFGVMGVEGNGTVCAHNLENQVDLYFATFTKSMASFGGIVAGKREIINYFKYNLRSQIFSKSLPMPVVNGLIERLKLVKNAHRNREALFEITHLLQQGLRNRELLSGKVNSVVTPIYFNMKLMDVLDIQKELVSDYGVFCSVVIYPVVPKDVVIFRLIPTSLHTREDVNTTLHSFDKVFQKFTK